MKEGWQWFFAIIGAVVVLLFYGWILSMTPEDRRASCLEITAETNCNTQSMEYKDKQQDHYYCIDSLKELRTKYYTKTELEKCENA